MNAMCGIEASAFLIRALRPRLGEQLFPEALPQAYMNRRPGAKYIATVSDCRRLGRFLIASAVLKPSLIGKIAVRVYTGQ